MSGLSEKIQKCVDVYETQRHDAIDLEFILNNAIRSLYILQQPEDNRGYTGENPAIGRISAYRYFERSTENQGKLAIDYEPSDYYKGKFRYTKKNIGTIDLRKRTYSLQWESHGVNYRRLDEDYWKIPTEVMQDTEKVVVLLGLEREQTKK